MTASDALDRWAAASRQDGTVMTPAESSAGDQIAASFDDLAARLGITLTGERLRAAAFVLLATQAIQQRHHGSRPADPAFEKETVDILGWLQWVIAHRLDGDAGPEPLTMVDHQGRRCRMELVGNDWLYRAHPIKEGT